MSPKVRASIFVVIGLAWIGLGAVSLAQGYWIVTIVDLLAASVLFAFAYRSLRPRQPSTSEIKPLRAPRPPR